MMEKNQYNDKGQKHGYWENCKYDGILWYKGNYINGLADGYWESYWYKGNYINGKRNGYWESYGYGGDIIEQIFYV